MQICDNALLWKARVADLDLHNIKVHVPQAGFSFSISQTLLLQTSNFAKWYVLFANADFIKHQFFRVKRN